VCHKEVLDEVHKQISNKLKSDLDKLREPKNYHKLFIKNFKMFTGADRDLVPAAIKNPKEFFCCSQSWPQCRFNFAKEHLLSEEFVFKVDNLSEVEIF
jgi:Na+/phosphate symporter